MSKVAGVSKVPEVTFLVADGTHVEEGARSLTGVKPTDGG